MNNTMKYNTMLDCCYGKTGYSTSIDAERVISRMHRRGTLKHAVKVYRCSHCGLYHMGSNMVERKRSVRSKECHK